MSINSTIGNGSEHRKELYELISEATGIDISRNMPVHNKIKKIIIDYVSDRQEDLIKRLQVAATKESQFNDRFKMIAEGSHNVCKHCRSTKLRKKF